MYNHQLSKCNMITLQKYYFNFTVNITIQVFFQQFPTTNLDNLDSQEEWEGEGGQDEQDWEKGDEVGEQAWPVNIALKDRG